MAVFRNSWFFWVTLGAFALLWLGGPKIRRTLHHNHSLDRRFCIQPSQKDCLDRLRFDSDSGKFVFRTKSSDADIIPIGTISDVDSVVWGKNIALSNLKSTSPSCSVKWNDLKTVANVTCHGANPGWGIYLDEFSELGGRMVKVDFYVNSLTDISKLVPRIGFEHTISPVDSSKRKTLEQISKFANSPFYSSVEEVSFKTQKLTSWPGVGPRERTVETGRKIVITEVPSPLSEEFRSIPMYGQLISQDRSDGLISGFFILPALAEQSAQYPRGDFATSCFLTLVPVSDDELETMTISITDVVVRVHHQMAINEDLTLDPVSLKLPLPGKG